MHGAGGSQTRKTNQRKCFECGNGGTHHSKVYKKPRILYEDAVTNGEEQPS